MSRSKSATNVAVPRPRLRELGAAGQVATVAGALLSVLWSTGPLAAQDRDPMLLFDKNGTTLRAHLQFGLNAVVEDNLYWDLAATTAPLSDFNPDTAWLESYVKPGLSFEHRMDAGAVLYGKLSAVASYTWGTDAFDTGDTGAVTLEEGYLGLKGEAGGTGFDLSLGPRELVLGTGMIIANGGSNGFERGALKLGPRKAWDMAAIGRLTLDDVSGTAFFLSPNELPSTDSENELGGLDLRYDDPAGGYMGATFVSVLSSDTPYPQAAPGGSGPPTVTPGARDGTGTLNLYAGSNPMAGALEGWTFTGDLALQRNDRIDLEAWAGRVTASHAFAQLVWSPVLTLGYQTFSGDDPDTTALERFDPLYYQGSPSAWATGSKSAATFINSNVNALTLALQVKPSKADTFTLRYAHIRANELNSPIQFGQATRVNLEGNVIAGVTDPHLADDLFLEWSRIVNRNTYLTAGLSVSWPGAGIDAVIGEKADPWTGAFVNVVLNY